MPNVDTPFIITGMPPNHTGEAKRIPLYLIDEHLAAMVAEEHSAPLRVEIVFTPSTGYANVKAVPGGGESIAGPCIDFELSPCECGGLEETSMADLIKIPLVTSSAYELFDLLSMCCARVDCLVEFSQSAWKIVILRAEEADGE